MVNLYDARGRKYKSIIYTNICPATTYHNEIAHYTFDMDTVYYRITAYDGNMETYYTPIDTTRRIFNNIGYFDSKTNAYYHYIKDHIRNICAVVNSAADTLIQSTIYYASGVPMALGYGRDRQPYLYNSKEFVEAHGLNTYDYGFRGYYAPIGRFTTIDPLAEQTPWQSPYSYAGNNFTNNIDWMGLGGMMGFSSTYSWAAVDENGIIIDFDLGSPDQSIYLVDDDNWDGTYWDLLRYKIIGNHIGLGEGWHKGVNITGKYHTAGGGYFNSAWGCWVAYSTRPRDNADLLIRMFQADKSLVGVALMDFSRDVLKGLLEGVLWNQYIKDDQIAQRIISKSTQFGVKLLNHAPSVVAACIIGYDIYSNGISPNNVTDAVTLALSTYLSAVAMESSVTGLISVIGTSVTIALGAGALVGSVYWGAWVLTEMTININAQWSSISWWGDLYGF